MRWKVPDTGACVPESLDTLLIQQSQLKRGVRAVQMFPLGTPELELPEGCARYVTLRGVFHYNPQAVTKEWIKACSTEERENLILNLGPYSKPEVEDKLLDGENPVFIVEYTPDGTEVRAAAGSDSTRNIQLAYFEQTKEPGNIITVGDPPPRVINYLNKGK